MCVTANAIKKPLTERFRVRRALERNSVEKSVLYVSWRVDKGDGSKKLGTFLLTKCHPNISKARLETSEKKRNDRAKCFRAE
ncbi:hypothetical protein A2V80_02875 [Candidatus Woesebacteria bacterium RBG_16_39_8b]|uniref:Uncharacterized protein n=1 Tax=Candidatus Woesebacteria bacterium RBG_16_39_8b TaxID=1802482 RepID=A0A1F7XAY0_9BACT|nr:MAG: hypothetical protein A2V80_02875 [Candidatus Woesebacteria bacterium RBG_16_39_8b]